MEGPAAYTAEKQVSSNLTNLTDPTNILCSRLLGRLWSVGGSYNRCNDLFKMVQISNDPKNSVGNIIFINKKKLLIKDTFFLAVTNQFLKSVLCSKNHIHQVRALKFHICTDIEDIN